MKWLPYENFYIDTDLKPDAAQSDLETEVGPDNRTGIGFAGNPAFSQRNDGCFMGTVDNHSFQIRRQVFYRNRFLPNINGTIEPHLNGSRIHVIMKLNFVQIAGMSIRMFFATLVSIVILCIYAEPNFGSIMLIVFAILIFGYVLTIVRFKDESSKARKTLCDIFQGNLAEAP